MEKFLLLIREDLKVRENYSPEESRRTLLAMGAWIESMSQSGNFVNADALLNSGTFGKNYNRLLDLKDAYDPINLFSMNQNITRNTK